MDLTSDGLFGELTEEFCDLIYRPFLATVVNKRSRDEYRRCLNRVMNYFYETRGQRYSFEQLSEDDAKDYHLHLCQLGSDGKVSQDYCRQQISICRSFSKYLKDRLTQLADEDRWYGATSYQPAFSKVYFPKNKFLVHTKDVAGLENIDAALLAAKENDRQLYIIFLFSFRMMMPQDVILKLKRSNISFSGDASYGGTTGVVHYACRGQEKFDRIPADIVDEIKTYVSSICEPERTLFVNAYGNPMNAVNLTSYLDRLEKKTGIRIRLGQLRQRAIADLVSQNPDEIDAIGDYTGLSKQMLKGYGQAHDRMVDGCIADKSSFKILEVV